MHNRFIENVKPSDYYKKITIEDVNNNKQYLDKIYELYYEYMLRFNMYIKYSKEDLIYLDMTFEEASKFIVSAGTSNPS